MERTSSPSGNTTDCVVDAVQPPVGRVSSAASAAQRLLGAEERVAAARRVEADEQLVRTLNGLVRAACRLLTVPSGQVSLLSDVQYVAGGIGAAAPSVGTTGPLDDSLCSLTAADRRTLALTDARTDVRVATLGPVRNGMVRGYLGVPLMDQQGQVIGSLCVFDDEPRRWSGDDEAMLQVVGRAVATELAMSAVLVEHEAERLRWTLSVDAGEVGSFDLDLLGGRLVLDARSRELSGYSEEEFDETLEGFRVRLHPDDVDRVDQAMATAVAARGTFGSEYRILLPDGRTRWVQARGRVLCDEAGDATRLLGAVYDTTQLHGSHHRTTRMLEAMPSGFLSLDTEWRFTVLNAAAERLLGHQRSELLGRTIWEAFPDTVGNEFERAYRTAVETQTPQTLEAWYPAPLNTWYEVLCWPTPDGLSLYFADISARRAAAEKAAHLSARLALLAEVNARMLEAVDVRAAVREVPRLLVPLLADGCFVTLLEADGRPRDVAAWHVDPDRRAALDAYTAGRLEVMPAASPVARVLATGMAVRSNADEVRDLLPAGTTRDLLESLDAADGLVLPIAGRDRVLGALSLFTGAGRQLSADDEATATATDIASRIGLALDNARLARAQTQIAEGLQRNLLTAPPEPDHAQIVVRYVPAGEAARVGGDWYDAFMQRRGATVLVIGDVVGHDVEAAASMAELRSLLRGIAASSGGGPAEILKSLDTSMELLEVRTMATAAVARLEQTPAQRAAGLTRLTWSNAGHPPPLVLHPDGRLTFLAAPRADLLLGVLPGTPRTQHEATLERDTTVLLYTDGLIERRSSDLDEGLDRLRSAVRDLADLPLDDLCDGVIDRLVDGRPDDDVALVAVRLHREDRPRPTEAGPRDVPELVDHP
ncbi:SpoIIE family protein phosphatase [Geodermatophilus normandii]|uniref:SpoIIE family protein phosphatase n=1 Tax=Geodermatophilus normandii TaxID=1137989 RepID=A0A6P0GGF5_9ACTN|nr:SpoIIE family protein phosphatase [Geodermatophilus normandii]NEM06358.1 SpoIIE family protein phosphatase [Geodermatophilus normandii]